MALSLGGWWDGTNLPDCRDALPSLIDKSSLVQKKRAVSGRAEADCGLQLIDAGIRADGLNAAAG
jgi:hypothetical protein